MVQDGTHAIAQGVLSLMQGGNFVHGAVAGFLGHLGAEAWGGAMKEMGYEQFAKSTGGMVAFGALSGGIGAELSGGNFWQGAVTGGIVAGLNHAMHKEVSKWGEDPPKKKFRFNEARDKYLSGEGGKISIDASTIDWSNADLSEKGKKGEYYIKLDGKHFSNADDALVHGTVTIEQVPNRKGYYRIAMNREGNCRCGMYDFEQHSWEPFYSKRNVLTAIGKFVNGIVGESTPTGGGLYYKEGKPFMIEYKGIFKIGK